MTVCYFCNQKVELPYQCNYCGEMFCSEHHLPEKHECKELGPRNWDTYRKEQIKRAEPLRQPVPGAADVGKMPGLLPSKRRRKLRGHSRVRRVAKWVVGCAILIAVVWGVSVVLLSVGNVISVNNSKLEKEVFELINQERIDRGLGHLTWDEQIAEVARLHSRDMVENNFFSHQNSRGEDMEVRLRKGQIVYFSAGEILLKQNRDLVIIFIPIPIPIPKTQSALAKDTVNGWLESIGHCMIMLGPYTRIGVGVWSSGLPLFEDYYFTAVLVS